jgi:Spy/CpxP family protein refolding chaperone/peroxiredoxin
MTRVLFRTFAVVVVGSAAWLASPAFADGAGQTAPAPQAPAGQERVGLEKLRPVFQAIQDLDLTADQRSKLREVMRQARKDFETLRKDLESMDGKQAKGVAEEFLNGVRDKVEAILTAEQRTKLEAALKEIRDERDERRKERKLEASANASQQPTTKPSDAEKDMPRRPFAGPIQRFADALAAMEMTGEQRDKVNAILAEAKAAFEKLRGESDDPDPQQLREKARELMLQTRDKLAGVLSAEQMQKLQESMGPPGARDGGRPERPNRPNRPDRREPPPERREPAPTTKPAESTGTANSPKAIGVGDVVAEFTLTRLDGKPFSSRSFAGKPAVIVFGSYSSPTFRDRIAAIDQLAKQYGKRATFVVVYTKEMHPAGEWEPQRNVDDNVNVAAHQSNDDRFAAARAARDKLKLSNIEIIPEPLGEPVSRQFAAEPTGAVVIDAKGVVVAKQKFAEAGGIDVHLGEMVTQ